jgi:hypothetical protein
MRGFGTSAKNEGVARLASADGANARREGTRDRRTLLQALSTYVECPNDWP